MYSPPVTAPLHSANGPRIVTGTDTMLASGGTFPRVGGKPTTPHRVFRGILHPWTTARPNTISTRALTLVTSGKASCHLGSVMLCLSKQIRGRWSVTAEAPLLWAMPKSHKKVLAGHDTRSDPAPRTKQRLTCAHHTIQRILWRLGHA